MQNSHDNVGISGAVSRSVDSATNTVHRVIDTASDKTHPAVDSVASGAHSATDTIAGAATSAAAAIDKKSDQLMDAQARLFESCRDYVQEKPMTALSIAVATGYVLNWLLRKS
ncbi:MAG: hypothetical protein Q8L60_01680 [Gammaproteobacteria bacterium]|nr:hypothetical protein [Gammaproteobacteria bacterium]MDP2142465.1 hypothetical protein [Gammaproteobacteria bacterium]MDP2346476.1 hypothetical protein [Gammaproteobacteria bacterium]